MKSPSTRKCTCGMNYHKASRCLNCGKEAGLLPKPSTRKWEEDFNVTFSNVVFQPLGEVALDIKAFISSAVDQAREEGFNEGRKLGYEWADEQIRLFMNMKPTKAKR